MHIYSRRDAREYWGSATTITHISMAGAHQRKKQKRMLQYVMHMSVPLINECKGGGSKVVGRKGSKMRFAEVMGLGIAYDVPN